MAKRAKYFSFKHPTKGSGVLKTYRKKLPVKKVKLRKISRKSAIKRARRAAWKPVRHGKTSIVWEKVKKRRKKR